jgi:hypothetical protein
MLPEETSMIRNVPPTGETAPLESNPTEKAFDTEPGRATWGLSQVSALPVEIVQSVTSQGKFIPVPGNSYFQNDGNSALPGYVAPNFQEETTVAAQSNDRIELPDSWGVVTPNTYFPQNNTGASRFTWQP